MGASAPALVGRHGGQQQSGQSTAELAMLLPVLAMAALIVVQIALVARDYVLVNHAVREAARQAALEPTEASAATAGGSAAPGLDAARIDVVLSGGRTTGDVLTVDLHYAAPTSVPVVGLLIGDVPMTGTASVRVE